MKCLILFLGLLLPLLGLARQVQTLALPESPRIIGMAGAFVAVADDPTAGFLNPSGLRTLTQVGYDLFYGSVTHAGPDQMGVALSNPGSDKGQAFGMGMWTQGWTEKRQPVYYVPYTGTSLDVTSTTHFGLVMRLPYVSSNIAGVSGGWKTIGDVTFLQTFESFRAGASIERAFGGGSDLVPRRLRVGGAFLSPSSGVVIAYEWRGNETGKNFNFHYGTSHYGAEVPLGGYGIVRGGYIAGAQHRIALGAAVGNMKAGMRVEGGWELPATKHGETRWVLGIGYRI
ncbi:MAG TPA: hypothetical protein VGL38_12105 [bacterium]|jgi:hypothetical protein